MSTKFLNRLDNIEIPNEYAPILSTIKNLLATDADLNRTFEVDGNYAGFCRIGDSASFIVSIDEDFEHIVLTAGF